LGQEPEFDGVAPAAMEGAEPRPGPAGPGPVVGGGPGAAAAAEPRPEAMDGRPAGEPAAGAGAVVPGGGATPAPAPPPGPAAPPFLARAFARVRAPGRPTLVLVAALVFVGVFYVLPLAILWKAGWTVFPFLGETASFLIQVPLAFLLLWAVLGFARAYEEVIPGLEGGRLTWAAERLNRATGQRGRDLVLLLVAAVCTAYLCLRGAWLLVPLGLVACITFLVLLVRAATAPWPVRAFVRAVPFRIPDVSPAGAGAGEGRTVRLAWTFPREGSEPGTGHLALFVASEVHLRARSTNPSGARLAEVLASAETRKEFVRELVGRTPEREVVEVAKAVARDGPSLYEALCSATALVASIPERSDADSLSKDVYWRFPIETLYDEAGDAIDKAILLAAVFRTLFRYEPDPGRRLAVYVLRSVVDEVAFIGVGGADLALPAECLRLEAEGIRLYVCDPRTGAVGRPPAGVTLSSLEAFAVE